LLAASLATIFAGIDSPGAFWSLPKPGAPPLANLSAIAIAPSDGSPVRTLWAGMPSHASAMSFWSDGAGGWIAVGIELFQEAYRSVVWSIDAHGNSRRLACSPADDLDAVAPLRPAITTDAVYLFADRIQDDGSHSAEIDRIAR